MTGELKEKIIRAKLTRKESLIAEYILDHLYEVCFMTASDLAKTLNTSNTSINRTAKALGYSVFADLQKELQGHVAAQAGRPDDRLSLPPSRRIVPREEDAEEDLLFQMYSSAVANLLQTTQKNSIDKIDSVVNLLADSRIKYINGYRSTADIANKFGFLLELITNNIVVASGENVSSMARLMDAGPEDCVLVLSFNRYYRTAQEVMESC
ncbi:MAG: MurR/RpiR family transcriptional regulator, partial [Oscillospiraceae bacterium]